MSSDPLQIPSSQPGRDSRSIYQSQASNEFIFAVVGYAGSGTSEIAKQLASLLKQETLGGIAYDVNILKARDVIVEWALERGLAIPPASAPPKIEQVSKLQDLGDSMREEPTLDGNPDHSAIARRLILKIQELRASKTGSTAVKGKPVQPDGKPRAYILDSIRHPGEVQMLRNVYQDAFVLVGVVCEEERRINRLTNKYSDGGRQAAERFMKRDANATEGHGQHVANAFHLSDYFIDNTAERTKNGSPNKDYLVAEKLSRLVKILTHSELVRPTIDETAMFHAHAAQMQSACLSRQVGAAVVDTTGNVVATGSNEVPKAGGGVYGETTGEDARCAMFSDSSQRYCRNTREQIEIVNELSESIEHAISAVTLSTVQREALKKVLRSGRIRALLEFSRAVHAEMDAILSAARKGVSPVGTRLFVTAFPCHYCARHIIAAGVDEVQYIEPYPKSQALKLHKDAIAEERSDWQPPSKNGTKVLFRPFSGVAPLLYKRAFMKDRDLKDDATGTMQMSAPKWGTSWYLSKISYVELEAKLSSEGFN